MTWTGSGWGLGEGRMDLEGGRRDLCEGRWYIESK